MVIKFYGNVETKSINVSFDTFPGKDFCAAIAKSRVPFKVKSCEARWVHKSINGDLSYARKEYSFE